MPVAAGLVRGHLAAAAALTLLPCCCRSLGPCLPAYRPAPLRPRPHPTPPAPIPSVQTLPLGTCTTTPPRPVKPGQGSLLGLLQRHATLQHCGLHALLAAGRCLLPAACAIAQSGTRRRLTPLFPLSACPCRRCRRPGLAGPEEQDPRHQGAQGEAGGRAFSNLPMSHLAEKGGEACPPKPCSRVSCCGTPATQEGSAAVVQQQGRFLNSCPSPLAVEYH